MSLNENVIKNAIKDASERRWTDAQIKALSPKLRGQLSSYGEKDGKSITQIDPEMKRLISERGFAPADGRAALAMIQDKTIAPMKQANSDWVISKGGNEITTKDKNTLYMCNGDKVVRPHTPIPANPENPDKFDNLDVVTAFCAPLVDHKNGVWKNAGEQVWCKTFPSMGASGLNSLAMLVAQILNIDECWVALSTVDKAATTGRNGAVFIRNAFNSVSKVVYRYLNTKIVADAFRAIEKTPDGEWEVCVDEEGNDVVPQRVYDTIALDADDLRFSSDYPAVLWYKGGWVPGARLPKVDLNLTSSLILARQKSIHIAGGDQGVPSLIAASQDFSGITNETAQNFYFIISSVLECWRRGKKADIRLSSNGDVNVLWSALSYWQDVARSDDLYSLMHERKGNWFYFLPATRNAFINTTAAIREVIVNSHTEGSVAVCVIKDRIKTLVDKTSDPVNHDRNSNYVLPQDLPPNYIVKCPIYGTAFFPKDNALARIAQKSTSAESFPQYNGVKVYGHGNARDFIGVASTLDDLCLVGSEQAKKGMVFAKISLVCYPTREKWYSKVSSDINAIYKAVFNPVKTLSPISNLLVITKGKVSVLTNLDDGQAVGYSTRVFAKGGNNRKKFMVPAASSSSFTSSSSSSSSQPVVETTASKAPLQYVEKVKDVLPPIPPPSKLFIESVEVAKSVIKDAPVVDEKKPLSGLQTLLMARKTGMVSPNTFKEELGKDSEVNESDDSGVEDSVDDDDKGDDDEDANPVDLN
jgi:hypothetical protein